MMGLQQKLLQFEGDRILLLPAWPRDWDVSFKLHAPQGTTVEGVWREGKWERLEITCITERGFGSSSAPAGMDLSHPWDLLKWQSWSYRPTVGESNHLVCRRL
jgi:hypothetical protein